MHALTILVALFMAFSRVYGECPLPSDKNILINSGFEMYDDSFKPWSVNAYMGIKKYPPFPGLRSPGYKSPTSLGGGPGRGRLHSQYNFRQKCSVCPGQPNIISFYYKSVDLKYGENTAIRGVIGDLPNFGPIIPQKKDNNTWQLVEQYFYKGTAPAIHFTALLSEKGHGFLYFDDIKVLPQNPLKVKPKAVNIVPNGDFETGTAAPWVFTPPGEKSNCSFSKPGDNSNFAFNCFFGPPSCGECFPVSAISQTFPATRFTRYLWTFDYKFAFTKGDSCGITAFFPGGEILNVQGLQPKPEDQSWHRFERGLIANDDNIALSIQLTAFYATSCNISIDNVSVREVV